MPVFDMVPCFTLSVFFTVEICQPGSFGNEGCLQLKMRIDSEKEKWPEQNLREDTYRYMYERELSILSSSSTSSCDK
jgi:hypothetical protein